MANLVIKSSQISQLEFKAFDADLVESANIISTQCALVVCELAQIRLFRSLYIQITIVV